MIRESGFFSEPKLRFLKLWFYIHKFISNKTIAHILLLVSNNIKCVKHKLFFTIRKTSQMESNLNTNTNKQKIIHFTFWFINNISMYRTSDVTRI